MLLTWAWHSSARGALLSYHRIEWSLCRVNLLQTLDTNTVSFLFTAWFWIDATKASRFQNFRADKNRASIEQHRRLSRDMISTFRRVTGKINALARIRTSSIIPLNLVFSTEEGHVLAVNTENGEIIWQSKVASDNLYGIGKNANYSSITIFSSSRG